MATEPATDAQIAEWEEKIRPYKHVGYHSETLEGVTYAEIVVPLFARIKAEAGRVAELKAEIAECRQYHLPRIAELERLGLECQHRNGDLAVIIGDIEQCRCVEGDSITILCDDPEADRVDKQVAVEACGDYTGYELQRFYAKTWAEALHEAANCARRHYNDGNDCN